MRAYKAELSKLITAFDADIISKTDLPSVEKSFGIIKIKSDFDFTTTVQNFQNIVSQQGDTKWF